ncbi:fimbrillin family protein [Odoribacter sp. OttesenSCG-928-G04]|nr:fimbrillin family protein [Odoribacter sp. OttesenSCG-928-G04]MDL2330469.1 fimbrillin family protein [Odoribacter sp. OttesenSCG-928-A06]
MKINIQIIIGLLLLLTLMSCGSSSNDGKKIEIPLSCVVSVTAETSEEPGKELPIKGGKLMLRVAGEEATYHVESGGTLTSNGLPLFVESDVTEVQALIYGVIETTSQNVFVKQEKTVAVTIDKEAAILRFLFTSETAALKIKIEGAYGETEANMPLFSGNLLGFQKALDWKDKHTNTPTLKASDQPFVFTTEGQTTLLDARLIPGVVEGGDLLLTLTGATAGSPYFDKTYMVYAPEGGISLKAGLCYTYTITLDSEKEATLIDVHIDDFTDMPEVTLE